MSRERNLEQILLQCYSKMSWDGMTMLEERMRVIERSCGKGFDVTTD